MIFQYCLSVYAINFFVFPSFTTFKIRIINQQNGDCNDSPLLDATTIGPHIFPVHIKIKGRHQLLIRVKLISFGAKMGEKVIGEGVARFDQKDIDDSLRIPIYHQKIGREEVAICSVDFLLSGHEADKNTNGEADKKRKKIENFKDISQDAYSHMSYTVEFDDSPPNADLPQKKLQSLDRRSEHGSKEIKKDSDRERVSSERHKSSPKKIEPVLINDRVDRQGLNQQHTLQLSQNEENKNESDSENDQNDEEQQLPLPLLQNSAYLSEPSHEQISLNNIKQQKKSIPKVKLPIIPRKYTNQNLSSSHMIQKSHLQSNRSNNPSNREIIMSENMGGDESMSPQKIRERMKEGENLISRLKKYLEQKQQQEETHKVHRHKMRRKKLKIEEMVTYKSQNNFIKYYYEFKGIACKMLKNLKAFKSLQNQIKDSDNETAQISLNKLVVAYPNKQKIMSFDAGGYRFYCLANGLKESPIDIKIPETQQGLKAIATFNDYGDFEGVLGIQEGKGMVIKLFPREGNNILYMSVLNQECFYLSFDIIEEKLPSKPVSMRPHSLDVSYRQMIEHVHPQTDLKSRIKSLSVQPWGFGHSYLNELQLSRDPSRLIEKIKERSLSLSLKDQSPPLSDLEKTVVRVEDKLSQKNEVKSLGSQMDNSKEKIMVEAASQVEESRFWIKKYGTSDSQEQESFSQIRQTSRDSSIKSTRKKTNISNTSSKILKNKKEITDIKSIRNGNRNNYQFKDKRPKEKKKQEEKQVPIKQMWQKLLIKGKIQEEQIQLQHQKKSNSLQKSAISNKNQKVKKTKDQLKPKWSEKQQQPSRLYGQISGTNEVIQVPQSWQMQVQETPIQPPLRNWALEIKNISIRQPEDKVEESNVPSGKFVKIYIKDKVTYFTQILFSGGQSCVLWKLSGCIFNELRGGERLEVQIYTTLQNKIALLGKTFIRVSKLYFLRNNHLYNGKILHNNHFQGELTLGFQLQEIYPFEVIQEEEDDSFGLPQISTLPYSLKKGQRKTDFIRGKNSIYNSNIGRRHGSLGDENQMREFEKSHLKETLKKQLKKHNISLKEGEFESSFDQKMISLTKREMSMHME